MFAGGTGKRFWPLSRKNSPKQFLSVIDNKPLISLKYEYLRLGFDPEDIFVSTGVQYDGEIQRLLPDLPEKNFIFEPEMRDNGPAVLYALMYVAAQNPYEIVSLQWSDHYLKQPKTFANALQYTEKTVRHEGKTIIMAVPARYASPHLGYIHYGTSLKTISETENMHLSEFIKFVEKPTPEVAHQYISEGNYAWNPAYTITTAQNIIDKYQTHAPKLYETIKYIVDNDFSQEAQQTYLTLEKISFDYIFSENLTPEETYVLNVDMGWSDVGEWVALKETLESNPTDTITKGNVVDSGSVNSLIHNYDDSKLVSTINLENIVVVNTKDVVAIFRKDDNSKLKEYVAMLEQTGNEKYL